MTKPMFAEDTDHGRFYFHPADNRAVPSITNIKGMKTIRALPGAAAKECASYASKNITKLAALTEDEIYQLVRQAPWMPTSKKNEASRIGDIVHEWIDQHIKGQKVDTSYYIDRFGNKVTDVPMAAKWTWNSFLQWEKDHKPEYVYSEFLVWNDTLGYAGTMDWAAKVDGKLTLADNKSGVGAYSDMALQLAAGAKAEFILRPDGTQVEMPQFERFRILHLRPRFYEYIPVVNIAPWWEAFKALKVVFDVVHEFEDKTLLHAPKIQVRVG